MAVLTRVAAVVASLAVAGVGGESARGGTACADEILALWTAGKAIPDTYSLGCYDQAIRGAPDDVVLYGDFADVVLGAKRAALRRQPSSAPPPAEPSPAVPAPTEPDASPQPTPAPAAPAPSPAEPAPSPPEQPATPTTPAAPPPDAGPGDTPPPAPPAPAEEPPEIPAPVPTPAAAIARSDDGVPLALELLFAFSAAGTAAGAVLLLRRERVRRGLPPFPRARDR